MASVSGEFAFERLWQHERFVRATLRNLLADENQVDDLAQETWLQALRQGPARLADPRAWLGTVARNLARSTWRSDTRRTRREAERPTADVETSVERGQEQLEMRQRVVQAILELDEPYRSVVVLRYEHGLSTRAIAERSGKSDATIRSQLSRAHEQLRNKLDREFGDRERWAALAFRLSTGRTIGLAAWLVPVAALTLVATSAWLWIRTPTVTDVAPLDRSAAIAAVQPESVAPLPSVSSEPVERVSVAATETPTPQRAMLQLRPAARLLDRKYYDDYELATFSFEWGLREDPERKYAKNDWEIQLSGSQFDVSMVTDDQSVIADLGLAGPTDLARLQIERIRFSEDALPVRQGHAYYVGTRDGNTDLATFVFVNTHAPDRSCEFDWFTTDGSGRAQGSLADPGNGRSWVELLAEIRRASRAGAWLDAPRVVLQIRSGDSNGNPNRINMAGEASGYVDEILGEPLDLLSPVARGEDSRAFCEGGWIPAGQKFVVTRVHYEVRDGGDGRPNRGRFDIALGDRKIVELPSVPAPLRTTWNGRVELVSGDESDTYLMASKQVMGQAVLEGHFEPEPEAVGFGAANEGFFQRVQVEIAPRTYLPHPRAWFQVRAGAGGGNPNRVNLLGKTSIYVDEVSERPLDVVTPVDRDEPSRVYHETGAIDRELTFVVTRVDYRGSARGDSNGRGELKLVLADETIFEVVDSAEPIHGVWTGNLRLEAGEETRTYLQARNSSAGEAILTGFFEARTTDER